MLSPEERNRYARHLQLAQVGEEGQQKLKAASVLVIGAGGLGCPVLQYLVAAGVGTIGIVDGDRVEVTNLQRQILFDTDDVGHNKAEVAARSLRKQNPLVTINAYPHFATVANVLELIQPYDIVIDGSDNFPTRYLVGDACVIAKKPLVFGAISLFEGQISVFNYQNGPSYRCFFPNPPQAGSVPNCETLGVLGVLPGVIGTTMAAECLKIILHIGEVLSGKVAMYDLLHHSHYLLELSRNEQHCTRTQLEPDYEAVCGIINVQNMEISVEELKRRRDAGESLHLVDVREEEEFEYCSIAGSQHVPLSELMRRYTEIDAQRTLVMVCHHGMRSAQAMGYLQSKGYTKVMNLSGGIHAWATRIDPSMPTY